MTWLRGIWRELFGLFVDDGRLAAFIVVWVALGALVLPRIGLPHAVRAALLFLGLAAILIESAARRAHTVRRP